MPIIFHCFLILSVCFYSLICFASDHSSWENVLRKTLNHDANLALELLRDRYTSLPPCVEKLYVSGLIHQYMTERNQQYFAKEQLPKTSYQRAEKHYIEALNYEKEQAIALAELHYSELYQLMKQQHNPDGVFLFEYHLCHLFNHHGQSFRSQPYCHQLNVKISESENTLIPKYQVLGLLAKYLEFTGDHKAALSIYKRLINQIPQQMEDAPTQALQKLAKHPAHINDTKNLDTQDLNIFKVVNTPESSPLLQHTNHFTPEHHNIDQQNYGVGFILFTIGTVLVLLHKMPFHRSSAEVDGLTLALHRTAFIKRIHSRNKRRNQDGLNLIILFDFDNLKAINDEFGYQVGNKALKCMSKTIRQQLNKEDYWSRLGGDEFMIVIEHVDQCEIQHRVEMLHKALTSKAYHLNSHKPLYVSASLAFLAISAASSDFDTLYPILDRALFQAKQNSLNCIVNACSYSIDERPTFSLENS